MYDIVIPKLNNNDSSYTLLEWLREEGVFVEAGEAVAVVETSKTIQDLCSEGSGILHQIAEAGTDCPVGMLIGRLGAVGESAGEEDPTETQPIEAALHGTGQPILTNTAREAATRMGVTEQEIEATNLRVLKLRDVQEIVAQRKRIPPENLYQIPRAQQLVARTVTQSHREIPSAFVAMKIYADVAADLLAQETARTQTFLGIPELLIAIIATLYERAPLAFASPRDDQTAVLAGRAQIGITIDTGTGLYLPVIKNPAELSLTEISDVLMDLRIKALRNTLSETELAGANIVLSLHNDPGVIMAQPIVFPGQTCMFSLCAVQEELFLTDSGDIAVRRFFILGLAYDHRLINGRDAVLLLQQVKAVCEDGAELADLFGL